MKPAIFWWGQLPAALIVLPLAAFFLGLPVPTALIISLGRADWATVESIPVLAGTWRLDQISALYELVEWGAAVTLHQGAEAFLGTQGDPWDTQEDMATCLVGAITALLLLSRWHDRQLAALESTRVRAAPESSATASV